MGASVLRTLLAFTVAEPWFAVPGKPDQPVSQTLFTNRSFPPGQYVQTSYNCQGIKKVGYKGLSSGFLHKHTGMHLAHHTLPP